MPWKHRKTEDVGSENLLSAIWENSYVGLSFVDDEGYWVAPSKRLCEMLRYTRTELERMRYQDVTHPDDIDDDGENAALVLKGELDSYLMIKRYITKDNNIIRIMLHVSRVVDDDGKFKLFFSQIMPAEFLGNPDYTLPERVTKTLPKTKDMTVRELLSMIKANWKFIAVVSGIVGTLAMQWYQMWSFVQEQLPKD